MSKATAALNGYRVRPQWAKLKRGEVPVFEAEDMCASTMHIGERHCAIGWQYLLGIPGFAFDRAYIRANKCEAVPYAHNDRLPTDADRAAAMNRTMAEMGFTQIKEFEYE